VLQCTKKKEKEEKTKKRKTRQFRTRETHACAFHRTITSDHPVERVLACGELGYDRACMLPDPPPPNPTPNPSDPIPPEGVACRRRQRQPETALQIGGGGGGDVGRHTGDREETARARPPTTRDKDVPSVGEVGSYCPDGTVKCFSTECNTTEPSIIEIKETRILLL
jgi:hypothetical protein